MAKSPISIRSYKDLEVWPLSMDLVGGCYKLTRDFPREEMYGLTSRMRRPSVSIAANIAEGYGRGHEALGLIMNQCERVSKMLRSMSRTLETKRDPKD